MAYVITDTCTKDEHCIETCPVNCIPPTKDEADFATVPQLYVNPADCIDCGACIPVCPIYLPLCRVAARLRSKPAQSQRSRPYLTPKIKHVILNEVRDLLFPGSSVPGCLTLSPRRVGLGVP
jgi:ferredoxin